MAYNRYNFLLRVKEVNEIYIEHHKKGVTAEYIHKELVYPAYKISRTTFFNYLQIPYKREIEKEEKARAAREAAKRAQKDLFDL